MRLVTIPLALASFLLAGLPGLEAATPPVSSALAEPAPHFEAAPGNSLIGEAFIAIVPRHRVLVAPGSVCVAPEGGATSDVIRFELVGADRTARATPEETLASVSHYLSGSDPAGWRRGVAHLGVLRYVAVLPGVDVVHRIAEGCVRTDYVVAPGADPAAIRLRVHGGERVRLDDATGDIVVKSRGGDVRYSAPRTLQNVNGAEVPVESRFMRLGARRFTVRVGTHDPTRALVIDPTIEYSSYTGARAAGPNPPDFLATDSAGAVYVALYSVRPIDFPATAGAYRFTTACTSPAAVRKYDPTGRQVLWTTYLSGVGEPCLTRAHGLSIDAQGASWLYSAASAGLPEVNPLGPAPTPPETASYLLKLAPGGDALEFASYLGDAAFSHQQLDDAGNLYLAGMADPSYPLLVNPAFTGSCPPSNWYCPLLMKVASGGSSILFATQLPLPASVGGLAIDPTGRALVLTGADPTNPVINAPFGWIPPYNDPTPHLAWTNVARVAPDGQSLDLSFAVPIGITGSMLVTVAGGSFIMAGLPTTGFPSLNPPSWTRSPPFPAPEASGSDGDVGFIGFDAAGAPTWSARLGGTGYEELNAITRTSTGSVLFGGNTESTDLPVVDPFQATFAGGWRDGMVGQITSDGESLEWLSYIGGGEPVTNWGFGPRAMEVVVELADSPVTGATWILSSVGSQDFPVTADALVPVHPRANQPPDGFESYPLASAITRLSPTVRPSLREPSALDLRPLVRPLSTGRGRPGRLVLGWEETMGGLGFNVSIGRINSLREDRTYDHVPVDVDACNLMVSSADIEMPTEDSYFLVTAVRKDPDAGDEESSYGRDSFGNERPAVPPAERCP